MRITIVQGAFLPIPPIQGGAVEKIWSELGKEFARRGHEVTHVSKQQESLAPEEIADGVRHIRVLGFDTPRSLAKLKYRDLLYSRRALKVLPDADILVTNTFWMPVLSPKTAKGKIYVHVARYPKGQMKFYGKAARLQTVSTVIGNAICKEAPAMAARVKVIPNFAMQSGAELGTSNREKCILYVGRLHPEKGIHLLVEAFRQLLSTGMRGWKLRLIGPWEVSQGGGGQEYFRSLRAKSFGIEGSVDWIGPVFDSQALTSHYQKSSIFVYPSLAGRGEASPLAPLEAMAEGCPPVVSSLECFADYLRPGHNGWTFQHLGTNSAANLANVLSHAINCEKDLSQVRECAIQTAREFSLPKVAGQFLSDFEEIASR